MESAIRSWLFAVAASLLTALAAWTAYRVAHSTLGAVGALLAAVGATMVVGAPFYVATVLMWPRNSDR
jgi:hypothetical protein